MSIFLLRGLLLTMLLSLSGCSLTGDATRMLLLSLFGLLAMAFVIAWWWHLAATRRCANTRLRPTLLEWLIGLVTDFFDTLGIGAFAPSTAIFRLFRLVPDELIPGTLNVGHTLATIAQALIFIGLVSVAPATLLPMIGAAGIGAYIGTVIVGRLPRLHIRLGMGGALVLAAGLMFCSLIGLLPAGQDALDLTGWRWWVGVLGNFVLGMLMPVGIGLYAPCMILVSLLGMSPLAAFPIMMGSCAFLMPVSSFGFFKNGRYLTSAALGLALGGVPGVLLAAYLVKSLPLAYLRWGVLVVVSVVGCHLLYAAYREYRAVKPINLVQSGEVA